MDQENNATMGLRFKPSDPMLIGYLYNKVHSKIKMCIGDTIQECDLYGQTEPWEIWSMHGGNKLRPGEDLYFFTKLKKKTSNGSRINRSVGTGTWKGEDSGSPIKHSRYPQLMGYKKRFRYEDGVPDQIGHWIIHEYSLTSCDQPLVLCKLRKNERKKNGSSH